MTITSKLIRVTRPYRLQPLNPHPRLDLRRMSSSESIAKLPTPLRDLITKAIKHDSVNSEDKIEVTQWIEKVANGEVGKAEGLKDLNAQLTPRTYIVDNVLTPADIAVYGALHSTLSQWQPAEYYSHPALTRYFDHIQTHPAVRSHAGQYEPTFSLVHFDLENAPVVERKAEPAKKKEKKEKVADSAEGAKEKITEVASSTKNRVAELVDGKAQKKEKKEKKEAAPKAEEAGKKKGGATQKAVVAEDAGEPIPSMIDLRVGHIVDVKKHPDADGLYVEQIDFGEETGPRTVVSGLVNYIPIEQMRNVYLVGVCNLKPANMRGVKSFAMVLCATSKDGKDSGIELIKPPENSKPGEKVYFEGSDFENATPLTQLNPKKKIFETVQPDFTTLETREAAWVNPVTKSVHKIRTKDGVCVAPSLVGASLS